MPYLRVAVATWKIDMREAEGQAIIQKGAEAYVSLLRRQPGFVRFQSALTGPRTTVQVTEWESEAQATAGQQRFAELAQSSGLAQQVDSLNAHFGEVIVSS